MGKADQSEDSEAVDLSGTDSEGDGTSGKRSIAKQTLNKAKKLTVGELKTLEDGGELPTTGILGMNFMRDAIKRKRESAKTEARGVLQELEGLHKRLDGNNDSDEDAENDENANHANLNDEPKRQFTEEELAEARLQVGEILEHDGGDFLEVGVSGPLTVHGTPAAIASTSAATASAPPRMGKRKKKSPNAAAATQ